MSQDKADQEPEHIEPADEGSTPVAEANSAGGQLVLPDQALPEKLYLIPIAGRPFFPAQIQPVVIDQQRWQETLQRVAKTGHNALGLVYVGEHDPDSVTVDDFPSIGCAVRVHNVVPVEGKLQLMVQGIKRLQVHSWLSSDKQ